MRLLSTCVTFLTFMNYSVNNNDAGSSKTEHIVAGIGNQVHVYSKGSERPILAEEVLPHGVRVHGVSEDKNGHMLVHGGRVVALVRLIFENDRLKQLLPIDMLEFDDWVWSTEWLLLDRTFAVACGHSKMFLCSMDNIQRNFILRSAERELTWSTTLFHSRSKDRLRAVAGSSFGDILVWTVMRYADVRNLNFASASNPVPTDTLQPVRRLSGHDGQVMRLQISEDNEFLASASVDRSVRVWKRNGDCSCSACGGDGCYDALYVNYGHLARVWDVAFLTKRSPAVVSVAEDRTCRIWSATGKEEAVFHGHAGRNVWSLAVSGEDGNGIQIATGGEDGSVKVRNIPCISDGTILKSSDGFKSEQYRLPDNYPNPRKTGGAYNEGGRTILFVENDSALISTDFGRLLWCQEDSETSSMKWKEVYRDERGYAYTPNSLCTCDDFIMAGQSSGNVTILRRPNGRSFHESVHVSDIQAFEGMVMGVFAQKYGGSIQLFVSSSAGELCQWRFSETQSCKHFHEGTYRMERTVKTSLVTSLAIIEGSGLLLVGDRGGRMLLYKLARDGNTHFPLQHIRLHRDRIASIRLLGSISCETVGFDGRIIELTFDPELRITHECRAQEHVDTIVKIVPSGQGDLVVGFRAAELVVWNRTQNSEMMRMNVGNWRRAHDIHVQNSVVKFFYWRAGWLHTLQCRNMLVLRKGTEGHGLRINCAKVYGRNLITGSDDTMIKVWSKEVSSWKCVQSLQKHISGVNDLTVRENEMVSVGGSDEVIFWNGDRKWRCTKAMQVVEGRKADALQRAMCVQFFGDSVVVGRSDGTVHRISGHGDVVELLGRCSGAVISISAANHVVVCGDTKGYVTIFTDTMGGNAKSLKTYGQHRIHNGGINTIALKETPLGLQVVTGGDDESVRCIDVSQAVVRELWRVQAACAAITDVACAEGYIFRIGADQRVVAIKNGTAVGEVVVDIADCSSIVVYQSQLVVVGIGLQMIPIKSLLRSLT